MPTLSRDLHSQRHVLMISFVVASHTRPYSRCDKERSHCSADFNSRNYKLPWKYTKMFLMINTARKSWSNSRSRILRARSLYMHNDMYTELALRQCNGMDVSNLIGEWSLPFLSLLFSRLLIKSEKKDKRFAHYWNKHAVPVRKSVLNS